MEERECENCGNVDQCVFTENPFAAEVYGDDTKHWLCRGCLKQLADDV